MQSVISPLQNQIISRLKNAERLRYSELQPDNIPNDLFNYHLQFLVKKGLLDRNDNGYALSELGVKYVADWNPSVEQTGIAPNVFKVNVLTIVSRMNGGVLEILQQLRTSQPSYGKIGVPGGVVRKGESIEDAATRKLKVETGLEAQFKIIGTERRIMYVGNEFFSDVFFPIAYADSYTGELQTHTEYGNNMWVPIDQAIKNESAEFDSITMLPKVFRAIKDGSLGSLPFFYTENTQSGEKI